jgi:hypothetical protein
VNGFGVETWSLVLPKDWLSRIGSPPLTIGHPFFHWTGERKVSRPRGDEPLIFLRAKNAK